MSSTCNAWNNRHFWSNMNNEDSFFLTLTIIREYAIPRIQTGSLLEILLWLFLHPEQNLSFCHGSCCLYYVSSSHSPGSSLGPTPSHPTAAHDAHTTQHCFQLPPDPRLTSTSRHWRTLFPLPGVPLLSTVHWDWHFSLSEHLINLSIAFKSHNHLILFHICFHICPCPRS